MKRMTMRLIRRSLILSLLCKKVRVHRRLTKAKLPIHLRSLMDSSRHLQRHLLILTKRCKQFRLKRRRNKKVLVHKPPLSPRI